MKLPRLSNMRFALRGLVVAWAHEVNVVWEVLFGCFFVASAWLRGAEKSEVGIVFLFCCAVLAAELTNSAIERVCNIVQPERDERIRDIKDIASGTVLFLSAASLAAWLMIML